MSGAGQVRRLRLAGAEPGFAAPAPAQIADYSFLLGRFIDRATLLRAHAMAVRAGVAPHEILIANGWITSEQYARALAGALGQTYAEPTSGTAEPMLGAGLKDSLATGVMRQRGPEGRLIYAAESVRPERLAAALALPRNRAVAITSSAQIRRILQHHFRPALMDNAVEALRRRYADKSAKSAGPLWHTATLLVSIAMCLLALALAPLATLRGLSLGLSVLFVPVVLLRLLAVRDLLTNSGEPEAPLTRIPDAELPIYTILVPLFREAQMVKPLLEELARLDYPAAKLDIKLILEDADPATIAAARAADPRGNVEIVIVPDQAPRTKPKALNYALPLARGEYLAIYDAEDRPERDQLRRALDAFRAGPPNLACLQAALSIYNAEDSFLTRQFALEYNALFAGLLPALARRALPIPLGGTSNHFRVAALKWLTAWDPYNVTEDADLGMRLARSGYLCGTIASTTYEEAPRNFGSWLPQRTRWLKGYMQTYAVHMRSPKTLWRELGLRGFLGFQTVLGGTVLTALVHPWFYVIAGIGLVRGTLFAAPASLIGLPLWTLALAILVGGYGGGMALAAITTRRSGFGALRRQIWLMPLYWLLVSAAAYRALWKFATDPFAWEKTEHGITSAPFKTAATRCS